MNSAFNVQIVLFLISSLFSFHLHSSETVQDVIFTNIPIKGYVTGNSEKWPVEITFKKKHDDTFEGQMTWKTLNTIARIEGSVNKQALIFTSTKYIKEGNSAIGTTFNLSQRGTKILEGTWNNPKFKNMNNRTIFLLLSNDDEGLKVGDVYYGNKEKIDEADITGNITTYQSLSKLAVSGDEYEIHLGDIGMYRGSKPEHARVLEKLYDSFLFLNRNDLKNTNSWNKYNSLVNQSAQSKIALSIRCNKNSKGICKKLRNKSLDFQEGVIHLLKTGTVLGATGVYKYDPKKLTPQNIANYVNKNNPTSSTYCYPSGFQCNVTIPGYSSLDISANPNQRLLRLTLMGSKDSFTSTVQTKSVLSDNDWEFIVQSIELEANNWDPQILIEAEMEINIEKSKNLSDF